MSLRIIFLTYEICVVFSLRMSEGYIVSKRLQGAKTKKNDNFWPFCKGYGRGKRSKKGFFWAMKSLINTGKKTIHVDNGPTCLY